VTQFLHTFCELDPRTVISSLFVGVGIIALIVYAVGRHQYRKGWMECRDKHVNWTLQRGHESDARERV
jgi:hypothetical protein